MVAPPMEKMPIRPIASKPKSIGGKPALCGTLLKSSRSSSFTTISGSLRGWEVPEDARPGENGDDGADAEQEQHDLEDLVLGPGRTPVLIERVERDDADDDSADDGDDVLDGE